MSEGRDGSWLRATGDDGLQHVLYLPERRLHRFHAGCPCLPRREQGVIVHQVLTAASRQKTNGNA